MSVDVACPSEFDSLADFVCRMHASPRGPTDLAQRLAIAVLGAPPVELSTVVALSRRSSSAFKRVNPYYPWDADHVRHVGRTTLASAAIIGDARAVWLQNEARAAGIDLPSRLPYVALLAQQPLAVERLACGVLGVLDVELTHHRLQH